VNDAAVSADCFIVFSDDWGEHPSSCQHLFRQLLARHRVIWVNTIGMRSPRPNLADFKKVVRKVAKMFGRRAPATRSIAQPHPRVCQPFMLPFNSIAAVRRFNRYSVVRQVRRIVREMNLSHPVVVSTVPNACDYVDCFDAARVVYYCVDDFSQWPGLEHQLVREMEGSLIAKADLIIATSSNLFDRLSAGGRKVHLVSHGVDIALFSQQATAPHACLRDIPAPRAGYFGLFDERSDQDLITAVARSLPEVSFVITGPVATDTAKLRACANVRFTGPLPYHELPALIRGLDVLFIPYVVDGFTASISPLKLKEYLVTGKPVVVTPIAEARLRPQFLQLAASPEEWVHALRAALAPVAASRHLEVLTAMAGESWEHKAREFERLCLSPRTRANGLARTPTQGRA